MFVAGNQKINGSYACCRRLSAEGTWMTQGQLEPRRLSSEEFASLYREHFPTLRLVAAAEVGIDDADDVVQQAAMVAMARLGRFESGTDFRAWMAAIVRGAGRNHRRSRTRGLRRLRFAGRTPQDSSSNRDPSIRPGTHGVEIELDFSEEVRNALESLEPLPRACLLLKVVLSHPYAEIAAILGIPETTARSHVHRSRQRLFESMGGMTSEPRSADGA